MHLSKLWMTTLKRLRSLPPWLVSVEIQPPLITTNHHHHHPGWTPMLEETILFKITTKAIWNIWWIGLLICCKDLPFNWPLLILINRKNEIYYTCSTIFWNKRFIFLILICLMKWNFPDVWITLMKKNNASI